MAFGIDITNDLQMSLSVGHVTNQWKHAVKAIEANLVSRCMVKVYDWSKHAANNCKVNIVTPSPAKHFTHALYIYGKVSEKRDLACIIIKHNKNALRLKCYNFRTVNAIVFLFSALHTIPFLYCKIHFGILNMLHASIAMSDTPRGSNPP